MRSRGSHPLESVTTAAALMASMPKTTECRPWSITAGQSMSPQASSGHTQTSIHQSVQVTCTYVPDCLGEVIEPPIVPLEELVDSPAPDRRHRLNVEPCAERAPLARHNNSRHLVTWTTGKGIVQRSSSTGVRHGSGYGFKCTTEQLCKTKLKLNRRYVRPRNRLDTHTHTQSRTQGTHPWSAAAQRLLRAGGTLTCREH